MRTKSAAEIIAEGQDAVVAYMREQQAGRPDVPGVADIIAAAFLRELACGVATVSARDIVTVLNAAEQAQR